MKHSRETRALTREQAREEAPGLVREEVRALAPRETPSLTRNLTPEPRRGISPLPPPDTEYVTYTTFTGPKIRRQVY